MCFSHQFVISFYFLFPDELDCKMSATPLADLDKAEWSGDTLYIIIGQDPSSQINLQNSEQIFQQILFTMYLTTN